MLRICMLFAKLDVSHDFYASSSVSKGQVGDVCIVDKIIALLLSLARHTALSTEIGSVLSSLTVALGFAGLVEVLLLLAAVVGE